MGRPQKPIKLHVLQGTNQKCRMEKRKGELDLPSEIPDAPPWLLPEGKAEWARLTKHGPYAKVLSAVDRSVLAMYCQLWGRFVAGERKGASVKAAHIAVMSTLASKLGLSPADRTKIRTEPEQQTENRFARLGK